MTPEELNELDNELILDNSFNDIYLVNLKSPIMDTSYLNDLNQKL